MYQIISNIDKTIYLQEYIDNKCGTKRVGLRSFTYNIGWYNIIDNATYQIGGQSKYYYITKGFYQIDELIDEFKKENVELKTQRQNGLVGIYHPKGIWLSPILAKVLGMESGWSSGSGIVGNKTIDLARYKQLYIHLEQINTHHNVLDGAPSKVLTVVPVENKLFGEIVHVKFSNPEYKKLTNGDITELSISVRDEKNNKIDNHGLPMSCVLEII